MACTDSNGWPQLDDSRLTPADIRGRWLVINYWAQWCKPCLEEIPELNQLAQEAADKVVVVGVNYDNLQGASLRDAVDRFGMGYGALLDDPQPVLAYERPTALPTTILIGPDGAVKATLIGPQTRQTILNRIQQLTDVTNR